MSDNKIVKAIKEKGKSLESEMSFFEHLQALRSHLVRAAIAIAVFTSVAFYFNQFIVDTVIFGPKHTDFWTYRMMCKVGTLLHMEGWCITKLGFSTISTEMGGQFNLTINSCIMTGIIFGFPYLLWELWRFIKPALHEKEKKAASGFVFYASSLFLIGILFGYFIMAPLSVKFLAGYSASKEIENMFSISSYLTTVTTLTLGSGIVFELPILIYILASLNILTAKFMRNTRRYAIVIILIIAAIITPTPDAITMGVVAVPLLMLYEVGIWVAVGVERRRAKKELMAT
jgi:sec-independent protein translocase protein TatC